MATSDERTIGNAAETVPSKQPWEVPTLTYIGEVAEIVQCGGGKLSTTGGDPGEPRKQQSGPGA